MSPIFCSKGHESPDSSLFCQVCGEKLSPPAKSLLVPGEVLEGRYRIVQQIGQGGFGRTYLCENTNRFGEPCVLKEFAPQVQGSYALDKAKTLFEREANVLHKLEHPQIPRFRELFQLNSGGGGLFLVQDYVAGPTYRYLLAQRMVQNQCFSEAEIRKFLIDTLPVLEYIHSLGVIHRDIAPDNLILRSSDNLPVLIDFGGVKQLAVNAEIQAIGGTDLPTCLGKVGYAPHEQLQRGKTYPHSDLYALAATALVLFTGKEPTEMIEPQNLNWNWRKFATLDPALGAVLDRMLHPNITARFQTATEVLAALQVKSAAGNSGINKTVVVSPGGQKAKPRGSSTPPASNSGELWPILRRSWLVLAGIAALGTGAWGISKMIPTTGSTPSPSTSPIVVESSTSSTATPASSSPSPSEQSSKKPAETNAASRSAETTGSERQGSGGNKKPKIESGSERTARAGEQRKPAADRSTTSRRTPITESDSTPETTRRTTPQTEAPKAPKTPSAPKEDSTSTDGSVESPASSSRSRRRSTEDSLTGNRRSGSSGSSNDSIGESSKPSRSSNRSNGASGESSKPSRSNGSASGSRSGRSGGESGESDGSSSRPRRAATESRSRGSNSGGSSSGSSRSEGSNSSKPAEEPLF
jgi:serine/threonine protein kinase